MFFKFEVILKVSQTFVQMPHFWNYFYLVSFIIRQKTCRLRLFNVFETISYILDDGDNFLHAQFHPTLPYYTPLHTLYVLVHTITNLICLGTCHYTPYMPWHIATTTHHMPWYTPLHALVHILHALVHTTTHIIWLGTHHYTPFIPWYRPLHTLLHAFVVCTHHFYAYMP